MDPVIKKEASYIAVGTVVISAIVQLVWSLFFTYDLSVFLGGLLGGAFAIVNFVLMGITVQKAASEDDQVFAKRRLQSSYSIRQSVTILVVVLTVILPQIDWKMTVASLFFPRLTILVMPLFRKELRKGGKD